MKRFVAIAGILLGAFLIGRIDTHDGRCESAYLNYGLEMQSCPSGTIRQTAQLHVTNFRRHAEATVVVSAAAHYTIDSADDVQTTTPPNPRGTVLGLAAATAA